MAITLILDIAKEVIILPKDSLAQLVIINLTISELLTMKFYYICLSIR